MIGIGTKSADLVPIFLSFYEECRFMVYFLRNLYNFIK